MKNIQQILEQAGLNAYECKLYLQLLYSGEQAASVVARASKIPRSTARGVLDQLCERGIVEKLYKRNTQFYSCKSPSALKVHLENRIAKNERAIELIENALPMLNAYFTQKNIAPKVRLFEGREQVIEAFNRSLFQEGVEEILIFTSYEFFKDPVIYKNDQEYFVGMRVKKGIPVRVLVSKSTESSKLEMKSPKFLRERRFIPEKYELPGNIHIYGESVLYFYADKDEYLAVLIEGGQVAKTMRTLFEFMWEKLAN